jgi:hypothetical protein
MESNIIDKNVIPFPRRRSGRVIESTRAEGKNILIALSVVSLVLVAVFTNEQVLKTQRPIYIVSDNSNTKSLSDLNRAIASTQPLNLLRDVEWEHRLAQRLGSVQRDGERIPASFGRPTSDLDQIRFGTLGGKYHIAIKSINGLEKIESIDYVESLDSSDRPQTLNRTQFLKENRSYFAVEYASLEYKGRMGSTEVYSLQDESSREVAQAIVKVDEDGRFLALDFTH